MDEPGAERRGRGREDEGAAAVDEEVAGYRGGAEQVALGAERLAAGVKGDQIVASGRSEEHTSVLQSLMRISYAVFSLQKKLLVVYFHSLDLMARLRLLTYRLL